MNVSTGPVNISKEVQRALAGTAVSHRSKEFCRLYSDTTDFLCQEFNVKKTYLLSGSGTAANEAMIWQIKLAGGQGLVLSNGEFGNRLIEQAGRASLPFTAYRLLWGECFETAALEKLIQQYKIEWILFCHCETSTGIMNDLNSISEMCHQNNCRCFVDCMSTVGTGVLNLSHVTMATASSGKGLASIPGLAVIFSNIQAFSSNQIPIYVDLAYYDDKEGIPFTISSNMVHALNVSIKQKLWHGYFELIEYYATQCFRFFNGNNLLPFNNVHSKVFTISLPDVTIAEMISLLQKENIIVSYESEYLKKRDFFQVALFGFYRKKELEKFLITVEKTMAVFA